MSSPSTNHFADVNNLFLNDSLGIQFTGVASDPTDVDLASGRLYFNSVSAAFKWYNGTSWQTLGTGGGGPIPSWETIYANDSTFALSAGTWTITQSGAFALLTLNKTNVGAGTVLSITNSGTGKDIANSTNWSVAASGGVGVLELGSGGTINATDGAITIGKTLTATTVAGTLVVTGGAGTAITLTTGNVVLSSGNITLTSGNAVLTSGNLTVTSGLTSLTSVSNIAASLAVINNTITTYGVGGISTGMVQFKSTSVTSGVLLQLQADESVGGGFTGSYLNCENSSGGAVFTVAKFGATTIAGSASGTSALTVTAGDIVASDGALHVTRVGDDAVSVLVTNNTVATAPNVSIVGSGAFTGVTTNSFVNITPTGLTTGTALYVAAAAATTLSVLADFTTSTTTGIVLRLAATGVQTGVGQVLAMTSAGTTTTSGLVSLAGNSLTTGHAILVSSTSVGLTSGKLLDLSITSSGTLAAKTGAELNIAVSMTHTANTNVTQNFNDVSIARTVIRNTGGADANTTTSQGSLLALSNTITATTGTITDTVKGISVTMSANGTGDGVAITHNSTSALALNITSSGVNSAGVVAITANSLTSNQALNISATGVYVGAGIVTLTATGMTTGSAVLITGGGANLLAGGKLIELAMDAATAGNGLTVTTSGVYAGTGLIVLTANGLTTGLGISCVHTTSVIANGGALLNLTSSGVNTATTTGCLVNLANSGSLAGTQVLFTDTAITTGCVMKLTHTSGVIANGGSMLRVGTTTIDTSTTTGVLLDLTATAATSGNLVMLTSATLTTGSGMTMTLNGLTSGSGLLISSSSADATTTRGLVKLSNTGAGALCPMISMAQVVQSTHFRKIFTESGSGISLWISDGTTANANLAATTGDICFNAGTNKPEYCTNGGGSLWTALV